MANGNMTSGDNRDVTWSSFNKPTQITRGSTETVNIWYGVDRARFKREDVTSTSPTVTTRYAMGGSFEGIWRGINYEEKYYIGDFCHSSPGKTRLPIYPDMCTGDHLGSVDVITDHTGGVVQRMSFDAWGKRREVNWTEWTMSTIVAFDTTETTRGFTNHEQLDPVGLIHMNGRVYDAEIGRFLSADPNVQDIQNPAVAESLLIRAQQSIELHGPIRLLFQVTVQGHWQHL